MGRNLDPRFILQKLGGRNEKCQTHAFVVPFPLLYSTKLALHALSVNLIEDNCTKIGQREGA